MKAKHKKVMRIGVFGAILLAVFVFLNSLFQPIWFSWGTIYTTKGFYDEPENSIEAVVVGPSVMASSVSPMALYDEFGICAYNLASVKQPMLGSYYWVEETYRLHPESLKVVLLDVSILRNDSSEPFYHRCLDYMRMSDVKLRAVKEYANGDKQKMFDFLLPIAAYHDRWDDLESSDLRYYVEDLNNGQRGYRCLQGFYAEDNIEETEVFDPILDKTAEDGYEPIRDENVELFERLVHFCKERDIEIVLTKMPTYRWDSGLHNQTQELADKHDLEFLDYNFNPLYDALNIKFPYDSNDGRHLNYYGGSKVTQHLGEYLVENCQLTDVRGLEHYQYMEEQYEEYDARVEQKMALNATETVTEYLKQAINEENSVFITVKDSAADALTEEQRNFFNELGLKKLAGIKKFDSYLAVIDREGKVVCEEIKATDGEEALTESGTVGGVSYRLLSSRDEVSCVVDGNGYAENMRGLNFVVYNHAIDEVINSTAFDTHACRYRDTYTVEKVAEVAKLVDSDDANIDVDLNSMTGQVLRYLQREADYLHGKEIRAIANENAAAFVNQYIDEDNLIILAGKKDVSSSLSGREKAGLAAYGLTGLSELEYGDSYVAIINGTTVEQEISRSDNYPITVEELGLYIKSAGAYSGNDCSININGVEYASGLNGLNIVVYNQAEDRVIDKIKF